MWGTLHLKYPLAFTIVDRLGYALLLFLAVLVAMVYHPAIIGVAKAEAVLHSIIFLVFLLLFMLSQVDKPVFSCQVTNVSWLLWGIAAFMAMLFYGFLGEASLKSELRCVAIPLCAIMVGLQMKMDEKRIRGVILLYVIGAVFVGLLSIFIQGSGFRITEMYTVEHKNAIGPLIATASILSLGMALSASGRQKLLMMFIGFGLALLCIALVLTIRARAALLAMALVMALMLFQRYRGNYILLSLWVALALMVVLYFFMPLSVKHYVSESLFSGFTNGDISSGRMFRNQQALQVIAENPLLGLMVNDRTVYTAHNYPLCVLCEFGLLGAFPFLAIYLLLFFTDVKRILKEGVNNLMNVGAYPVLALFVISMFEFTYPFGPGTTTMMSFVLLGVSLQHLGSKNTGSVTI